jgi:hypothetical protein
LTSLANRAAKSIARFAESDPSVPARMRIMCFTKLFERRTGLPNATIDFCASSHGRHFPIEAPLPQEG